MCELRGHTIHAYTNPAMHAQMFNKQLLQMLIIHLRKHRQCAVKFQHSVRITSCPITSCRNAGCADVYVLANNMQYRLCFVSITPQFTFQRYVIGC